MKFFEKKRIVSQHLSELEKSCLMLFISNVEPFLLADALRRQLNSLLEVRRSKLRNECGIASLFIYQVEVESLDFDGRHSVAVFRSSSLVGAIEAELFMDDGVLSQLYIRGSKVNLHMRTEFGDLKLESHDLPPIRKLSILSGWVKQLYEGKVLSDLSGPIMETQLQDLMEANPNCPTQYVELIKQANGACVGEYVVSRSDELVEIRAGEHQFVAMIDLRELGAVGFDAKNGQLLYMPGGDDACLPIGYDFKTALERVYDGEF